VITHPSGKLLDAKTPLNVPPHSTTG